MARPAKYQSANELKDAVDRYLGQCAEQEKPPTVAGLSRALGFRDSKAVYELVGRKDPGISQCAADALLAIEEATELLVLTAKNPAGPIFLCKTRFGMQDRIAVEHSGAQVIITTNIDISAERDPLEVEGATVPLLPGK